MRTGRIEFGMAQPGPELAEQLLNAARTYPPATLRTSQLGPLRESILTFRARRFSYEHIAVILKSHGVIVAPSTIGYFCRRNCPATDVARVRRQLESNPPTSIGRRALLAAPTPVGRRGPKIARDDL